MRVVVLYESRTGNTRRAAELLGGAAAAQGHSVAVHPVRSFDFKELALADVVLVGTWCDGLILLGHRPGSARQIDKHLPVLDGKQVGVFMTYAINPGKGLRKFARLLEAKGAAVVAGRTYRRDRLDDTEAIASLVDAVLYAEPTTSAGPAESAEAEADAGADVEPEPEPSALP
jgi:flavodoxin